MQGCCDSPCQHQRKGSTAAAEGEQEGTPATCEREGTAGKVPTLVWRLLERCHAFWGTSAMKKLHPCMPV